MTDDELIKFLKYLFEYHIPNGDYINYFNSLQYKPTQILNNHIPSN